MDGVFSDQTLKSNEVEKSFNFEASTGDKKKMEEPTTNGHTLSNHITNHVNDMGDFKEPKEMGTPDINREHKHSSSGSENKHKQSSSDNHKHSSSSDKHKSSSSDKHKHSSSSDKHKSSSSDKHRSSSDKHKSSSDKHHSSSSSKHKDGSSSKHHSSSSSKHSSSSSSKDPSKHSSSSSKDPSKSHSSSSKHSSSSSSKHKDGSSSHSSSKHSSSSSKHSSSSSSKHKSSHGDREKSGESRPKDASPERTKEGSASQVPTASPPTVKSEPMSPMKVKPEPVSPIKINIKQERVVEDSDDDVPLSARMDKVKVEKPVKRAHVESDEDDDEPLSAKLDKIKKVKKEVKEEKPEKKKKRKASNDDFDPSVQKKKKKRADGKAAVKTEEKPLDKKALKKQQEEETKWKWWEEDTRDEGVKWRTLEHKGPVLAPDYEPLPDNVRFSYNGKHMKLSLPCEEVATFYGRMLDHDYTTKEVFNKNFFKDWRKTMNSHEKETITDLTKCDFREILQYFKDESEKKKNRTKEQKQKLKEDNEALLQEYGFCIIDGHKQKIGNFRIEPPGLFRGRGDHPKQGMLKTRTMPEDVIINCSKGSNVPKPPAGHKWKEVRHDNTVTWLACWNENIQGSTKYVMLNAASRLKGEKDWKKYETARNLHKIAHKIRAQYRDDWKSKEMRVRQRSVAMYFIDKLALRAGNEKDEDQADTVGCCSLRVEHINLHEEKDGEECVVEFDFLGKDSIRYYNKVSVERRVFKNLQLFKENKNEGDDLFDRLNTATLNKHLQGLMDGLTAKVFRTYNASKTLQEQLDLLTKADDPIAAKLLSYNRANRAVAVLCNHQRAAPKNFDKQMQNMQDKIDAKKEAISSAKKDVKQAKADLKALKTESARKLVERKKKMVERLEEQLTKLEVQATDKDENKEIALGTSKLNYLDPRISVAWCKKWEVPIEKVYNKTQRDKFAWAIDMADDDFSF